MIDHLRFHTLLLLGLLWLCMTVYWLWRRRQAATVPAHRQPVRGNGRDGAMRHNSDRNLLKNQIFRECPPSRRFPAV